MSEQEPKNDFRRFMILFILLITTVFAAILAGLQSDAGIRADKANVQSQYYAVLASAELFREGQQSAFDLETLSTHLRHLQESTVLEYSALQLEGDGNLDGAMRLRGQAHTAAARADAAKQVSFLFVDPRYAPSEADGFPDMLTYISDQVVEANSLVAKQNTAADAYHFWDNKGNSYLTVLSILALVFFLLGIAQNSRELRVFFTTAALSILLACGVATLWILIS
jgi:hypothetical protein